MKTFPPLRSRTFVEEAAPDLKRRSFLFGVAATSLVITAPKSFFIMPAPKLIVDVPAIIHPGEFFIDLPPQQMLDLLAHIEARRIEITAIPKWLLMTPQEHAARLSRADGSGGDAADKWHEWHKREANVT